MDFYFLLTSINMYLKETRLPKIQVKFKQIFLINVKSTGRGFNNGGGGGVYIFFTKI